MKEPFYYERNDSGYGIKDRRSPRRQDKDKNPQSQPDVAICWDVKAAQIITDALNAARGNYTTL